MNEQAPSKRRFSQISKQNKMNVVIFFASFGNMCTAQYINLYACKKTNCGMLIEDIHSFRWFFVLIWPLHNSFLFAFFLWNNGSSLCKEMINWWILKDLFWYQREKTAPRE